LKWSSPEQKQKFADLLFEGHTWPCYFEFKFIVPTPELPIFKALFEEGTEFQLRESSGGKYTSVNMAILVKTPQEVIEIYERVAVIRGIVSL
jgi:uncharacterized protein